MVKTASMRYRIGAVLAFFGFISLFSSPLYSVIILVHGSFGATQDWWRPGGDFFNALEIQAKILGHRIVPFCWSGNPTEHEIMAAAGVLAKLVVSYPQQESIIFIGHSHGGNVINKATQLLYDPLPEVLAQASSRPLADVIVAMQAHLVANPLTIQNHIACPIISSNQQLHTLDLRPTLRENKSYLIEKIYLLGTPVSVEKYHPQMNVVGSLINLFSDGDLIQPVLGLYQRQYPPHERIENVELRFMAGGQNQFIKPGHSALHDQLVGRWVLHIPELLQKERVGNVLCLPPV